MIEFSLGNIESLPLLSNDAKKNTWGDRSSRSQWYSWTSNVIFLGQGRCQDMMGLF